ncbi:hypothetical protein Tco_0071387 [Tanacetum coccineum]
MPIGEQGHDASCLITESTEVVPNLLFSNSVCNPNLEANVAPVVTPITKASIPFPSRRRKDERALRKKLTYQIKNSMISFRDLSFEISFTDCLDAHA